MTGGEVLLEAEGLHRRFGERHAVAGVDFRAHRGEVLGVLGPNGAGKTTTLRMLAGLLSPTSGRVVLGGSDLAVAGPGARRILGYLPEQAALYDEMTVVGQLRFLARVRGLRRKAARDAVDGVAAELELEDVLRRVVGTLSRGYRQRVAIAGALVHQPDVVLLDEPTSGLDPRQVVDARRLIGRLGRQRLVLLSTHLLAEASQLCDRVLIIHRGRQVALGRPADLDAAAGERRVRVTASAPAEALRARLTPVDGVEHVEVLDAGPPGVVAIVASTDPRAAVARAVHDAGWDLLELAAERPDLEQAFLSLTR